MIDLEEIKRQIKSACEFYLKYKDKPRLFVNENPEYSDEINELLGNNWKSVKSRKMNTLYDEMFNSWLFRLVFKNIIGDKNDR